MEGLSQSVLSRIPFVRSSVEEPPPVEKEAEPEPKSTSTSPPPIQNRRQRKGSLRKTILVASSRDHRRNSSSEQLAIPSIDPITPRDRYGSTTDEDADHLTLRARSHSGSYNTIASTSPIVAGGVRRKGGRVPSSLAKAIDALESPDLTTHDYSETEWWGWIILIATWIVFVVGMGSCLEIWSWAWDVGETPYAPPELEDDPTLPIVGYYPALLVMTGVMAWVWVIVAWVGMKYFRHARVWDGDD
jgi:hypothetical protein